MKTYSLTEAQRQLALTPKQLRRLLADMGIEPSEASFDKRVQMLSEDQIERVRLGLPSQAMPARPAPTNDQALTQRVALLERQVADQARQIALLRRGETRETRVPGIDSNNGTNGNVRPTGAIIKSEAARQAALHGGNSDQSANRWFNNSADLADLESVIRRVFSYLAGHPHAGIWRECDQADCPCHRL